MRNILKLLLVGLLVIAAQSCAGPDKNTPSQQENQPGLNNLAVADHTVIDAFETIPDEVIDQASSLRVYYKHASTGGYVSQDGLEYLQGTNRRDDKPAEPSPYEMYRFDRRNWNWPLWRYEGLNKERNLIEKVVDKVLSRRTLSRIKIDEFTADANSQAGSYDVLGMKLCYLDWQDLNWKDYRDTMLKLEKQYPDKIFLWATIPLQYTWDAPTSPEGVYDSLKEFNTNLRAYAKANNKPLFDIADIESHRADGSQCVDAAGRELLCQEYYSDDLGHPGWDGSIRLAKAFWFLMAQMSGWTPGSAALR